MNAMTIIIGLIGGLGLFLYGMKLMGEGLENAAGEGLKSILEKATSNKFMGVLVGAIITAVVQSSSATTVMVVGFVNAGLMNLSQAVGVIMGANIGTTITAQLVAFKLDTIAPIFVGIGVAIVMFSKSTKRREFGNIILGFGMLFMGMAIMGDAMKPIAESQQFKDLIIAIGDNWSIGIVAGLAMTAVVQSSSATTAILIALAGTGSIDMSIAIPIILGCNIGTCVTALLSSIGTSKTARKAAIIHLCFNVIGTLIFIPLRVPLAQLVQQVSPLNVQRQIANAHAVFNITNTIILLPLSNYLILIANKVIKGDDEIEKAGAKFIDDRLLETPVIALGQLIKEVLRMANKAKQNVEIAIKAFESDDEKLVEKVYKNEKIINVLEQEITTYLVKLSKTEVSDQQKGIIASTFHVVNDIERIGDHAENIADLTNEKIIKRLEYTSEALEELKQMYDYTIYSLQLAIESYENNDPNKVEELLNVEQRIDTLEREFRSSHIRRLNEGKCTATAGAVYLDIISNLERIGDHSTNIAENINASVSR
ncbi:Na/Pi-cotransporter family protein/PhoU family protein [Clostridium putrefaciens]|uniref:Na/Pi-cotransporter family protein/PhoU family protein n=1 Tax=Clostridium putrefaciens TaxID=99675 RepID=A0A381JCU6_9CLOT|nr:Na/Pi cotransporter family protein [Clostridium putrefaciens]SUY48227.1 Na/Pi-cotransporter family protein/PhoU family protein [Clostridium putrefaciens]